MVTKVIQISGYNPIIQSRMGYQTKRHLINYTSRYLILPVYLRRFQQRTIFGPKTRDETTTRPTASTLNLSMKNFTHFHSATTLSWMESTERSYTRAQKVELQRGEVGFRYFVDCREAQIFSKRIFGRVMSRLEICQCNINRLNNILERYHLD